MKQSHISYWTNSTSLKGIPCWTKSTYPKGMYYGVSFGDILLDKVQSLQGTKDSVSI